MHQRRVVITGLGVLAPNGCGKETFWQACLQGRSGIGPVTRFAADDLLTRITGEIQDFAPAEFGLTPTECTLLGRSTQFAVAAANMALADAGLSSAQWPDTERERVGVYMGVAMAGIEEGEQIWERLTEHGVHAPRTPPEGINPVPVMLSYMPSAVIAAHHRLCGPCLTIATGCSAGGDAIGQACWQIQEGRAERMLAGGTDSTLTPIGLGVFNVIHALST